MRLSRLTHVPTFLIASPLAFSLGAFALLVAFPHSLVAWNVGAWTMVAASGLLALVLPLAAWALARNAAARTWPRAIAFAAGVLYLATLAIGAIT
ncbi:MAG TPA: hypothetical protein VFS55_04890 [Dokdonella sp.]|nr:hypothetical protein [Dokdonella sp.]